MRHIYVIFVSLQHNIYIYVEILLFYCSFVRQAAPNNLNILQTNIILIPQLHDIIL